MPFYWSFFSFQYFVWELIEAKLVFYVDNAPPPSVFTRRKKYQNCKNYPKNIIDYFWKLFMVDVVYTYKIGCLVNSIFVILNTFLSFSMDKRNL